MGVIYYPCKVNRVEKESHKFRACVPMSYAKFRSYDIVIQFDFIFFVMCLIQWAMF